MVVFHSPQQKRALLSGEGSMTGRVLRQKENKFLGNGTDAYKMHLEVCGTMFPPT